MHVRKRPPDASSQKKQQEPKSTTQQVKLPANKLRELNPENKNTIISDWTQLQRAPSKFGYD
jgi:hypothetical protein